MSVPQAPQPPQVGYAKAIMSGIAGAVVTLIVTIYNQYAPAPLPAEAVASLQTIVTGLTVLFTPHNLFGGQ
jgi:hypothetical protein